MPIRTPPSISTRDLSKPEFDERDRLVMRCAYAAQNKLGRLCEERVYENDLARRLKAAGFQEVHTQVPVTVTHGSFEKIYRLDLLADHALYELKATEAFTPGHDAQVFNYTSLLSLSHGKLLNFRPPKVQGRLRYNAINPTRRRRLTYEETRWSPQSEKCKQLMRTVKAMLEDWGGFLDFRLYQEGLIHELGGEAAVIQRFPLTLEGVKLGEHSFSHHDPRVCFTVSGFSDPGQQYNHLAKLLELSPFAAMQWINFHHHVTRFETLVK